MAEDRHVDPAAAHVLVVGVVRNCEASVLPDASRIADALIGVRQVSWLLVESDSSDGTVAVLEELAATWERFRWITLGSLRDEIPQRTARIAHCRNHYLRELEMQLAYADVDYVVVADFDGLNDRIDEAAFASCWNQDLWDVCAANQDGPYYDVWALRHPTWCPGDCWGEYRFLRRFHSNAWRVIEGVVLSRMIRIPSTSEWLEVDSAFGGFAVYRAAALRGMRYVGLTEAGHEVCEHVELHRQMRLNGYRAFVNPRLINAGYTEHTRYLRPGLGGIALRARMRLAGTVRGALSATSPRRR